MYTNAKNKIMNYKRIKINGKNLKLHRYVWEQFYGLIPEGYVIHHIDNNKHNNKIENLQIMTHSEHSSLHNKDWNPNDITRKKMSESKKGKPSNRKGKKHSEETKKLISEAGKGRPAWNKNLPHSEEHKLHLKEARHNRKFTKTYIGRQISIDNVTYCSINEASRILKVSRYNIYKIINNQ